MAAPTGVSLHQIAQAEHVSYSLVCRWAKQDGWLIVRRAHKAAGIPALYHYGAVQAFLADRDQALGRCESEAA
jgi:hypothetical protein